MYEFILLGKYIVKNGFKKKLKLWDSKQELNNFNDGNIERVERGVSNLVWKIARWTIQTLHVGLFP